MVKYREILRLASMGISQRCIAYSCGCSQSTVSDFLKAAKLRGVSWPLPQEMDDKAIKLTVYPPSVMKADKAPIDHEYIEVELAKRNVTMALLWNEYCANAVSIGEEPYMYSAFCKEHRRWAQTHNIKMHIERRPGEQMQVDWVGDTGCVVDCDTGEISKVYVFVGCLPYSSYLFAEGFYRVDERAWIEAHNHMFAFFEGSTPILVPDNTKTAVLKNTKEELILNPEYRRMSEHYGCAIVPARVRHPRDKGAVEASVGLIERQALAAMRNMTFFSLEEFNRVLAGYVEEINERPYQKREGSRKSIYLAKEKPMLIPLPAQPYEILTRKAATVNFNYHVAFDGCWYSVPYSFVRREVSINATAKSVAITCDGKRIALHKRCFDTGEYITDPAHMPENHRSFIEWSGERFTEMALKIGPATKTVMDGILKSKKVEQQTYRSCKALLNLADKYGDELLEEACGKALLYSKRPSFKTVKSIVSSLSTSKLKTNADDHAYLRGPEYYANLDKE